MIKATSIVWLAIFLLGVLVSSSISGDYEVEQSLRKIGNALENINRTNRDIGERTLRKFGGNQNRGMTVINPRKPIIHQVPVPRKKPSEDAKVVFERYQKYRKEEQKRLKTAELERQKKIEKELEQQRLADEQREIERLDRKIENRLKTMKRKRDAEIDKEWEKIQSYSRQ
jgi:hypothetical protein